MMRHALAASVLTLIYVAVALADIDVAYGAAVFYLLAICVLMASQRLHAHHHRTRRRA